MTNTFTNQPQQMAEPAKMLVDCGHLAQYALDGVVDKVAARLVEQDEDLCAELESWRDGFAFEGLLAESPNLARRALIEEIPVAVTDTWREVDGQQELALDLLNFHSVYAVRAAPIIQVMAAWLTTYKRIMLMAMDAMGRKQAMNAAPLNGPVASAAGQDTQGENGGDGQVGRLRQNSDARAMQILSHAFHFGFNKHIKNSLNMNPTKFRSKILFSFNISKADEMMREFTTIPNPMNEKNENLIEGKVVVGIEDLYSADVHGSRVAVIFRRMSMDTDRITQVDVRRRNQLVATLGQDRTCKSLRMLSSNRGRFEAS